MSLKYRGFLTPEDSALYWITCGAALVLLAAGESMSGSAVGKVLNVASWIVAAFSLLSVFVSAMRQVHRGFRDTKLGDGQFLLSLLVGKVLTIAFLILMAKGAPRIELIPAFLVAGSAICRAWAIFRMRAGPTGTPRGKPRGPSA